MGPVRLALLAGLLVLMFTLPIRPIDMVHAQTQSTSVVRIQPAGSCCIAVGSTFTVNVVLDLAPGQIINGFDVRINYSNPFTSTNHGTLEAGTGSVNYSGNIFDPSGSVTVDCVNDIAQAGTSACSSDDSPLPGQIHLQEVLVGKAATTGGRLFSIGFKVTGTNTSVLTLDRANLINPYGDPSNPQTINPVFIPVVKQDGIFGNTGVVAFFNYQPDDTTISPAILPNELIDFNANASFVGTNNTIAFKSYSWDFGNGVPQSGQTTQYTFPRPGNYTVKLTAVDVNNNSGNITRTVSVVPALGKLDLMIKDQLGNVLAQKVTIRIFNSTLSTSPFATNITSTEAIFDKLSASSTYYLSFSGPGIDSFSKTESVRPGWTTQDTVYLALRSPPADYTVLIYAGSLVVALGILVGAIIYQKRASKNKPSRRSNKQTSSRPSRRLWTGIDSRIRPLVAFEYCTLP